MPNSISNELLKIKFLERWENEGGRLSADSNLAADRNSSNRRRRKLKVARATERKFFKQ